MDMVFRVEHRPGMGETLLGREFGMFLGGKGFNQAVACRRLGADVAMVGRVGEDYFGGLFRDKLAAEGIDAQHVALDRKAGTGVASPVVDDKGENSIIAVPRANMRVVAADVDAAADEIARADVLMLQFEIPQEASERAASIAHRHGTLVVLDPAPAHHHARPFRAPVDILVPNEVEAAMLAGSADQSAWQGLLGGVARTLVVSLGAQGAMVADGAGVRRFPALKAEVVDTTGAGDAFRAGLAVMLAEGSGMDDAVRFANACGALACTVLGTEPSMPRRPAVETRLAEQSQG
jgi:ribokinase